MYIYIFIYYNIHWSYRGYLGCLFDDLQLVASFFHRNRLLPSKSTAAIRSLRKRCSYRWPLWVKNSTTRFEEHDKKEASWRWPGLGWGSGGGGIKRRPGGGLPQSVWCFPPSKEIYIAHLSLNSMHEGCQAKRCRSRTGRDKKAKNDRTAFWNDPVYI